MDNLSTTIGSNGTSTTLSHEEYLQRLGVLADRWLAHQGNGLVIRHQTGKLLNDRYGDPTKRQSRGKGILREAAERLRTTQSELSRMRRFAYHFESMEDWKREHPEAATWTAVKGLLPKLKAEGQTQGEENPSGTKRRHGKPVASRLRRLRKAKRFLQDLFSAIREAPPDLTEEERNDLLEQFRKLAEAVSDCLQIPVSVGQVSAEAAPPAGEVSAESFPPACTE